MYVIPSEPQSAGGILDAAFKLFRASFGTQLVLSAIVTGLMTLPLVGLVYVGAIADPFAIAALLFSARVLAACLALTLVCAALYAAMMVRMEAFARGEAMSLGGAVMAALRAFPRIAVATIIFIAVVSVGLVVVVPGLLFAQSLMFYLPAIALDDKGAVESLGYSHRLVWGSWWRTAGIWGFGVLIAIVAVYAAAAIALLFTALPIDLSVLAVLEIATQAFATLVVTPFVIALWLELYRDLKLRRESDARAAQPEAGLASGRQA